MLLPRKLTSIKGKDSVRVGLEGDSKALDESTFGPGGIQVFLGSPGHSRAATGQTREFIEFLSVSSTFCGYASAMQESFGIVGH